jgi:hypothetical protein
MVSNKLDTLAILTTLGSYNYIVCSYNDKPPYT